MATPTRQEWESAICDSDLPPTVRHVLMVIKRYISDKTGKAWPTIESIARDTGLGTRTVKRVLKTAENLGWITKQRRYGAGSRGGRWDYFPQIPGVKNATKVPERHLEKVPEDHLLDCEKCDEGARAALKRVPQDHPNHYRNHMSRPKPTPRARAHMREKVSEPASVSAIINPDQHKQNYVTDIMNVSIDNPNYRNWWIEVIRRMERTGGLHVLDQAVQYAHDCSNEQTRNTKDLGLLERPGAYIAAKCRDWLYQHGQSLPPPPSRDDDDD